MDNQTVLQMVLATDQLLNDFGNLTRMENDDERHALEESIMEKRKHMQRVCYDPIFLQ